MNQEHPFAQYVRILGKGKNGSRPLTQDEAKTAMAMILEEKVTAEQLGAFLMLMRVKEETAEEVAGFVQAVQAFINIQMPDDMPTVDLDWSSYAGKRRQLPWFILSSLLLAENGITVFMHGASGHTAGRVYTKDVLATLGLPTCKNLDDVSNCLKSDNFAYIDIEQLCPKLHEIIELRPFLGLRSPVHTIARMINPLSALYSIIGIFHPGYQPTHQQAAIYLQQPNLAVLKGDGGEAERNPDMDCLVQSVHNGEMVDEVWPAMFQRRHVKDEDMDVTRLAKIWQGDAQDEYGIAATIGTTAIALKSMGKANSREDAESLATQMWQNRSKERFGAAA